MRRGWSYDRTFQKPSTGIDRLPWKGIRMPNSNSASCPIEGKACLRTIKKRCAGVVLPLIRVTNMRCLSSDGIIMQHRVCLEIWYERTCGTTWHRHMAMTAESHPANGLLLG